MPATSIEQVFPTFTDIDGQPLEDGYIWVGTVNLDPQTNPISIFSDAALTVSLAQPVRTIGGYPVSSGTPIRIYANSEYSVRVMNKNGSVVYSAPSPTARYPSSLLPSIGFQNRIMNGKMDISQRGTSFVSPASGAYTLDRFSWVNTSAAAVTITQQADAPSSNEFQNSLRIAITTADTSITAGDLAVVSQDIEGFNVRDLIGRPFTMSFWVRSSKTGTHCVAFRNNGRDRSWIAEYTINAANTWEFKTITVSGGLITAGTQNWTNGSGLQVVWTLAAGSTFQTTASAWQTGNFTATANQVNCLDSTSNIFAITGVQLEQSSAATPFDHRPVGTELALCQRYYFRVGPGFANGFNWPNSSGLVSTTTTALVSVPFPVPMRVAPTALEQSGTAANYAIRYAGTSTDCSAVPTFSEANVYGSAFILTVASGLTAGQAAMARTGSASGASAFFGWSAEL